MMGKGGNMRIKDRKERGDQDGIKGIGRRKEKIIEKGKKEKK